MPSQRSPEELGQKLDLLDMLIGDGDGGIRCPKCHCRDLRVRNVQQKSGSTRRYRVCRHCGHVIRTVEKPG